MIIDNFKIAFRSLMRRKLRSWLTLIGIIIGITSVVALIGLGQGLQVAISGIFGGFGTDKITVQASGGFGPPGTGVNNPITKSHMEKIRKIQGVDGVAGRLVSAGKIEYNDIVGFGYAMSMPDDPDERQIIIDALNVEIIEGRILKESDNKKALMGHAFLELDDHFGKKMESGSKFLIQDVEYEVVGIMDKLGSPIFDGMILLNEDEMREMFELDDEKLDVIVARLENEDESAKVKESIEELMRKERKVKKGEEDFSVSTPAEAMESVNSTLGAVNWFVIVIAAFSILVGGIGIMNTMYMSVTERIRDIGIMKSIGARNSTVFSLFFIESGLLGSIGGLLGALFGTAIAMIGAYAMKQSLGGDIDIRADIGFGLFMGSVFGSFVIGSLFGTLPAIKASMLSPVDALRHKK